MFQERPGFARLAAVATVSACCLAAVACSGGASDALANVSGSKVATEALANAESASSLTLNGSVVESGQAYTVDLGIKPGKGCAGTFGEGSKGSVKLVILGLTAYVQPDATFWKTVAGSHADLAIQLFRGKYLMEPSSSNGISGMSAVCGVSQILGQNGTSGTLTKGKVTTLGGVQVLPLKATDGSVEYVTDTSKPEVVQVTAPKGSKNGSGKVDVTIGAPVTLKAPPANEVIDATKLGV